MNTYNRADFARLAGGSVKTLQRWDREGQLKPAARTPGNQRIYAVVWSAKLSQGDPKGAER
jgi:predicted site-specific integrase-resolvase